MAGQCDVEAVVRDGRARGIRHQESKVWPLEAALPEADGVPVQVDSSHLPDEDVGDDSPGRRGIQQGPRGQPVAEVVFQKRKRQPRLAGAADDAEGGAGMGGANRLSRSG